jgi:hypothetical protein
MPMKCPECWSTNCTVEKFFQAEGRPVGFSGMRYQARCLACNEYGVSSESATTAARRWGWQEAEDSKLSFGPRPSPEHYGDW